MVWSSRFVLSVKRLRVYFLGRCFFCYRLFSRCLSRSRSFLLLGSDFFNWWGGDKSGEALHQAAFAAGCVVLMDHAFFGGFIQCADRLQNNIFCFGFIHFKSRAGSIYSSASRAAEIAIMYATLFILTVSFDLRLNVCQGFSPKMTYYSIRQRLDLQHARAVFYMRGVHLSS